MKESSSSSRSRHSASSSAGGGHGKAKHARKTALLQQKEKPRGRRSQHQKEPKNEYKGRTPPAPATAAPIPAPDSSPVEEAASCSGAGSSTTAHCAGAGVQLSSEESEAKDGMHKPPLRRPLSLQQQSDINTATRAARTLMPPPRRKRSAKTRHHTSSSASSSSSRSSSSSSNSTESTSTSTNDDNNDDDDDDDDRDSRDLCERCWRDRCQRKHNKEHRPGPPRPASKGRRSRGGESYSEVDSRSRSSSSAASRSASTSSGSGEEEEEDESGSSTTERLLSRSSSFAEESVCVLTDVLPRDLYLHICSFLSETECCTLLEVSLRMHAAITSADSYVWRRLCVTTWQHKQGFQTFLQRVRALEVLARREEREVQALQQHMLLLREQETFLGESDVSATCDDATVLIRRRQHERAQWMAAASPAGGVAAAFGRTRHTAAVTNVGSSTTSASSETLTSHSSDSDAHTSHRRRGRRDGDRGRRTSRHNTHRSNATAVSASTARRSGRRSPRTSAKESSAASSSREHMRGARVAAAERADSEGVGNSKPESRSATVACLREGAQDDSSAAADSPHAECRGDAVHARQQKQHHEHGTARDTDCARADGSDASAPPDGDNREKQHLHVSSVADNHGERAGRRVRIRLPDSDEDGEDGEADRAFHSANAQQQQQWRQSSTKSHSSTAAPSSPGSSKKRGRRHPHSLPGDTLKPPQRQSSQQQQQQPPPISKHRRSHSVKKRKPAKQRRKNRGRSRRPRATGGGGGRHRSQHHRSQSRHHRPAPAHHHHHNPKATKSTRRRRRRQRNAAAAAAAANDEANDSNCSHAGGGSGQTSNGVPGAGMTGHGSPFFYQTPTYEAIKSTTPVLGVQHVAPALVPFQLGGRPLSLQSAAVGGAATTANVPSTSSSPVSRGMQRYPSRDSEMNLAHRPPVPSALLGRSGNTNGNNNCSHGASASDAHGEVRSAAEPPLPTPAATPAVVSRPPPLVAPPATAVSATVGSMAPVTAVPSTNSTEDDGLYWWQLTPEARHQQLRRMQQREQRQQQQQQKQQQQQRGSSAALGSRVISGGVDGSPDGEEVADEAALREWDALEASFGSSDGNGDDEANIDDGDEEDEVSASDNASAEASDDEDGTDTSRAASATTSDSADGTIRDTWRSRSTGRLCSHHRRTSSSRNVTKKNWGGSRSRGGDAASSTSSDCTHTSPPSCHTSDSFVSGRRGGIDDSHNDENSGSNPSCREGTSDDDSQRILRSSNRGRGEVEDEEADSSSSSSNNDDRTRRSMHTRRSTSLEVLSYPLVSASTASSSSRLSARGERRLAKALAKRYEGIEEAMIITRSKSVLIHTLERQSYAQLPRLLAAAAQRQRRVTLAARSAAPATTAAAGTGPTANAAATAVGPPGASDAARAVGSAHDGSTATRPVVLLGGDRTPAPSPPIVVGAASTLPSSLSNAFPTSPGVALTVPASPLHQLARISSSTALADGAGPHPSSPRVPSPSLNAPSGAEMPTHGVRVEATRDDGNGRHDHPLTPPLQADAQESMQNLTNAPPANEEEFDVEEEDEPLAPVSWKFAFFMSRREARRATITLQDLLEGMWLVCFRSTGRTHPVRFTRHMQVIVYPPLRTAAEEEGEAREDDGDGAGGGGGHVHASRRARADSTAVLPSTAGATTSLPGSHLPRALPRGAALLGGGIGGGAAATATPTTTSAAAPPLPFHILQGGAQLIVHQFPPMKVSRRSVFAGQSARPAATSTSSSSATMATLATANGLASPSTGPRSAAAEAEQRFAAEPQATLRRLLLGLAGDAITPSAASMDAMDGGCAATSSLHHVGRRGSRWGAWHESSDAAEVTQNNVRRGIAYQLGFAAAYVRDVLGSEKENDVPAADFHSSETKEALDDKLKGKLPKKRRVFGPPTRKEYDAQQRLEACFAPGGAADVLNDWGWTITGPHVKIFSLDVTAPLYVERLQRIVDVEVIGRSHSEQRKV